MKEVLTMYRQILTTIQYHTHKLDKEYESIPRELAEIRYFYA